MENKLSREELIIIVDKIINCNGTEDEIDQMIEILEKNVTHPEVSDLIFWGEEDLTAEQIVDKALNYKPLEL